MLAGRTNISNGELITHVSLDMPLCEEDSRSMPTEMGEYLVGAYLQAVEKCHVVAYNVRPPESGLEGLGEFDVVAFDFQRNICYLGEIVTHILGLSYRDDETTVKRLFDKHQRQRDYSEKHLLPRFESRFQLWSPVVSEKLLKKILSANIGYELIVNDEYTRRIRLLQKEAEKSHDIGNPAFRLLQIISHMREKTPFSPDLPSEAGQQQHS